MHLFLHLRLGLERARLAIVRGRLDDETFLRAVYRVCLGREPDENGKRHYLEALQSRRLRRSDVVAVVRDSPEGLERAARRKLRRRVLVAAASAFRRVTGPELYARRIRQLMDTLCEVNGHTAFELLVQSTDVIKPLPRYGFTIVASVADEVIGRRLIAAGVHEDEVTAVLMRYLKPDTRFVDVGANIGFYSLLAASRCPQGKVFSFEPDARNFRLLQTSIAYNGFESIITAYPFAVSDEDTTITVSDLGNAPNSGARFTAKDEEVLRQKVHGPNPQFRRVRAVTLDALMPDEKVDILKIDIEGHEPFALRGMAGLLKRNRPVIFAELAPSNLRDLAHVEPEAYLTTFVDLGYELQVIAAERPIPYGRDIAKLMADFPSGAHHVDILALPG